MHKKSKGAARRGMMKSKGAARRGKTNMSKGYARGGTKARMGKTKMAAKGGKMTLAKLRKIAGEMNYKLVKKKLSCLGIINSPLKREKIYLTA